MEEIYVNKSDNIKLDLVLRYPKRDNSPTDILFWYSEEYIKKSNPEMKEINIRSQIRIVEQLDNRIQFSAGIVKIIKNSPEGVLIGIGFKVDEGYKEILASLPVESHN